MAELDPQIPLSFLSGAYTKNYFKDSPLSSMMDTYLTTRKKQQLFDEIERKKQAFKNVAQARKSVESKYNEQRFNKAESEQTKALDDQIIAKQAELDAIDKQIADLEMEQQTIINETPVMGAMTTTIDNSPYTPEGARMATNNVQPTLSRSTVYGGQ